MMQRAGKLKRVLLVMLHKRSGAMVEKASWRWVRCLRALCCRTRPAGKAAAALPPPTPESPAVSVAGNPPDTLRRILIIEDDAKVAEVILAALRLEGSGTWELRSAASGEEALNMIAAQPVDLILLDVRLPGMSGAEVYRRLRAAPATRSLPIIFLSGGTAFDLYLEGIQEGVLLRKPFDVSELLAVVRANLPGAPDAPAEE